MSEREVIENQLRISEQKIIDFENKIGMIVTENERLNHVIAQNKSDYEARINFLLRENESLRLHVNTHNSENDVHLAVQIKENEDLKRAMSSLKQVNKSVNFFLFRSNFYLNPCLPYFQGVFKSGKYDFL